MSEFNDRIAAQRHLLRLVNRKGWEQEELFGLSRKAIERWTAMNRLDPKSPLATLVEDASAKLFFLANKSQEQISEEYKAATSEIALIAKAIDTEIGWHTSWLAIQSIGINKCDAKADLIARTSSEN